MKTNFSELGSLSKKILKQKDELSVEDYISQLEIIVGSLAQLADNQTDISIPKKGDFLEKMSFEIRTPMNSILGFTGLLKDSYFSIDEKNEFINLIEKNTEQLVQLLSDLTDLTRIENHQFQIKKEEFGLNVFVLHFISDFKSHLQEHHIRLKKSNGTHLKENTCITTDPYHLRHILDNLMLNMMAFSENSNIWMHIALENNQYLVIKFSNDDVELPKTISRSIKKHIADSLQKANFDGTGLRLTLTKALVDQLNGEIYFNCDKQKGSEFIIKIPVDVCPFEISK